MNPYDPIELKLLRLRENERKKKILKFVVWIIGLLVIGSALYTFYAFL